MSSYPNFTFHPEFAVALRNLLAAAAGLDGDQGAETYRRAAEQLQELEKTNDELFVYCSFIMATKFDDPSSPDRNKEAELDPQIRSLAALQIRNNIRNNPRCSQSEIVRDYIFKTIEEDDPSSNNTPPPSLVQRAAAAAVVNAITSNAWPSTMIGLVLDKFQASLEQNKTSVAQAFIFLIFELVEDAVELVDRHDFSARILDLFIPLLQDPKNLDKKSQNYILQAVTLIIELGGENEGGSAYNIMIVNNNDDDGGQDRFEQLAKFVISTVRSSATSNQDDETKLALQYSLRCFHLLFAFDVKSLLPYFEQMTELVLSPQVNNCPEDAIRTEIVEFWRAAMRRPDLVEQGLHSHLSEIIQILIKYIPHSDEELETLLEQENDWQVPDKKPEEGNNISSINKNDEWNSRKAALSALDDFAQQFGDEILEDVMSFVDENLNEDEEDQGGDWKDVEAAIAAFGCLSTGCSDALDPPRLQEIISLLCNIIMKNTCNNNNSSSHQHHFLIVSISLWTLGRYSEFLIDQFGDRQFLEQALRSICSSMSTSTSKLVQAAAIVALQNIADAAGEGDFDNFATQIIDTIATCLGRFQLKNCMMLFECIESLVSVLRSALGAGDDGDDDNHDTPLLPKLMEPVTRWLEQTPNDSPLTFPLFACMGSICTAAGKKIMPLAETLFNRSMSICESIGPMRAQAIARSNDENLDLPPKTEDFLVAAVDLLSSLFEALGSSIEPLVQKIGPKKVMDAFISCANDVSTPIRASAFAVLGEVARSCIGFLQPSLPVLLPLVVKQLNRASSESSTSSNAAWMISEILNFQNSSSDNGGPTLQPSHFDDIFRPLVLALIDPPDSSHCMQENFCVCIGIMIAIDPEIIDRHGNSTNINLSTYLQPWCRIMRGVAHTSASLRAVRGMIMALSNNSKWFQSSSATSNCVHSIFDVCLSAVTAKDFSNDLQSEITSFLNKLKEVMGEENFGRTLGQYKRRKTISESFNVY